MKRKINLVTAEIIGLSGYPHMLSICGEGTKSIGQELADAGFEPGDKVAIVPLESDTTVWDFKPLEGVIKKEGGE